MGCCRASTTIGVNVMFITNSVLTHGLLYEKPQYRSILVRKVSFKIHCDCKHIFWMNWPQPDVKQMHVRCTQCKRQVRFPTLIGVYVRKCKKDFDSQVYNRW